MGQDRDVRKLQVPHHLYDKDMSSRPAGLNNGYLSHSHVMPSDSIRASTPRSNICKDRDPWVRMS